MKKALIILSALLAGCVSEQIADTVQPTDDSQTVQITVSVPAAAVPETRGMDGLPESEVRTVDVLVFRNSWSAYYLAEHVQGRNITSDGTGISYATRFVAELTARTGNSKVMLIANATAETAAAVAAVGMNASPVAVLEKLTVSHAGNWGNNPIPMYAEKNVSGIASGININGMVFERMLARIDVRNDAANLAITRVHLARVNDGGYIARDWNSDGTEKTGDFLPAVPTTAAKQTTIYDWVAGGLLGEIYTFPAVNTTTVAGTALVSAPTRVVIEGEYNGNTYFWPVDFSDNKDGSNNSPGQAGYNPATVKFLSLLRNRKYTIDIEAVEGIGYASFDDALAALTKLSNLKTTTFSVSYNAVTDISFNGQYWLGSDKAVISSMEESTTTASVQTNYSLGWEIDASVYPGGIEYLDSNNTGWLTSAVAANNTSLTAGTVTFTIASENATPTGAARTARLHLIAGSVRHAVEVVQEGHISAVKAVYGVIGYIWNPGQPNHLQLTIAGDKDYVGNDRDGELYSVQGDYRVYCAYFRFGSLVALSGQWVNLPIELKTPFSASQIVEFPSEWALNRTIMESKFAGAAPGGAQWDRLPMFPDYYPNAPINTEFPSAALPAITENTLGDPCQYYDAQYFGGRGWKTPSYTEFGVVMGAGPGSNAGAGSHTTTGYQPIEGGLYFPNWQGEGSKALPVNGMLRGQDNSGVMISETTGHYLSSTTDTQLGSFQSFYFSNSNTQWTRGSYLIASSIRCIIP